MRFEYCITGTFEAPEGSKFVDGAENLIQLPSGHVISIHPIVEMSTGLNTDDHANLTYPEAQAIGVDLENYDRNTDQIEED